MSDTHNYFLSFPNAPLSRRISFWHWLFGAVILLIVTDFLALPLFSLFNLLPEEWKLPLDPDFPRSGYGDSLMLWIYFIPAFITPFLLYKYWHKLPLKRLLTTAPTFRWNRLLTSFLIVLVVYGVATAIEYTLAPSEFDEVVLHPDWSGYFIMLGIMLILLPIQSASEEILCRGYLNQGLSLITKRPWIAFLITSGMFAALHMANPEADAQMLPYMVSIFAFGMAMCWLSYADQGLESAIGVHIGNNFFVFTLFGYADPDLPHSAIWTGPESLLTWRSSIENVALTLALTFIVIRFNRWREKREQSQPH